MPVQPNDVVQVVMKMTQAAQQLRNVYHVVHAGLSAVPDNDFMSSVATWMENMYAQLFGSLSSELAFDTVEAINLTQNLIIGERALPSLTAGTDPDNALPLQVAPLVRFPTGVRGVQCRKFVPGFTEDDLNSNGVLLAATTADLAAYAAFVLGGFAAAGQAFAYGAYNPALNRFAKATAIIINDIVSTQRRRKQGIGI